MRGVRLAASGRKAISDRPLCSGPWSPRSMENHKTRVDRLGYQGLTLHDQTDHGTGGSEYNPESSWGVSRTRVVN